MGKIVVDNGSKYFKLRIIVENNGRNKQKKIGATNVV